MTLSEQEAAKIAGLTKALAPFNKPAPIMTDRGVATRFHELAVLHVHTATERRRWKARIGSAARFYGDLWTPERAKLVRKYRDLARHHRALARAAEAAAQAQKAA